MSDTLPLKMQSTQFVPTARKLLDFLISDFGAVCSEGQEVIIYDFNLIQFRVIKGKGEIEAYFQVKSRDFRYWYMSFSLGEIGECLRYLNSSGQPPQTKVTSPLTRAIRQASTEEERDELLLQSIRYSLLHQCLPILQGDLLILELTAMDRNGYS